MSPQQQPAQSPNLEEAAEADFRQNLLEVIIIVKKLAPLCKTVDELIDMAEFATRNDAQLRLLIREVSPLRLRP